MDEMMKFDDLELDVLLSRFEEAILKRQEKDTNSTKSNRLYKEVFKIFQELRKRGALESLEPLITNNNHEVAMFATKYFLLVDEDKAIANLKEMSKKAGIQGFAAENLIEQWEKGEINFNY